VSAQTSMLGVMTDAASGEPLDTPPHGMSVEPVRLVHGTASPEELSALLVVVAVLASATGDGEADENPATGTGSGSRSRWSSLDRTVRTAHNHGPGGWRASASPR
jgi:hypothetical protein